MSKHQLAFPARQRHFQSCDEPKTVHHTSHYSRGKLSGNPETAKALRYKYRLH